MPTLKPIGDHKPKGIAVGKRNKLLLVLIGFLWLFSIQLAYAGKERVAGLTVTVTSNTEIQISAEMIRWIQNTLLEDIENGIQKDLFYTIILKKRIPFWYDEDMETQTIKHTFKFDVLKKQYIIKTTQLGETKQQIKETTPEVLELISKINNVKLTLERSLKKRHTYYISVKAEMRSSRLPFYLDYILFFIPSLELDTPWANSAPFYALE